MKAAPLARSWFVVVGLLTLLEMIFLYEGIQADLAGYQRIFGVFVGLAILCFGALLYSIKAVFYDEDREEGS
jgi:hypothetical protein